MLDTVLETGRRLVPPVHRVGAALSAFIIFLYLRLVASTTRLKAAGDGPWPDIPDRCILALWHGDAPSLLVAIIARRPKTPLIIMVATGARGDCLALLCRMLGLQVVRGDDHAEGRKALAALSGEIARGACVIITVDGGGPARRVKKGVLALASASRAPIVPLASDCRPSLVERHKWDRARNPVPFGTVAIALGRARRLPVSARRGLYEEARGWLQEALAEVGAVTRRSLGERCKE